MAKKTSAICLIVLSIILSRAATTPAWEQKGGLYQHLIWSTDSNKLYYSVELYQNNRATRFTDIFEYDLLHHTRTCLTPNVERFTLSPDHRHAVFLGRYGLFETSLSPAAKPTQLVFKDPTNGDQLVEMGYHRDNSSLFYIAHRHKFDEYELWEYRRFQKTKTRRWVGTSLNDPELARLWSENVSTEQYQFREWPGADVAPDRQKMLTFEQVNNGLVNIYVRHIDSDVSGLYFRECEFEWIRWLPDGSRALIAVVQDRNSDGYPESPATWLIYVNRLEKFKIVDELIDDPIIDSQNRLLFTYRERLIVFDLKSGQRYHFGAHDVPADYLTSTVGVVPKLEVSADEELHDQPVQSGYYIHRRNLWRFDKKGAFITQLTQTSDVDAVTISPNGEKIAYVRQFFWLGQYPYHEIWLMNANGTSQKKIVDKMTNF